MTEHDDTIPDIAGRDLAHRVGVSYELHITDGPHEGQVLLANVVEPTIVLTWRTPGVVGEIVYTLVDLDSTSSPKQAYYEWAASTTRRNS